jgi:hypothetical protein
MLFKDDSFGTSILRPFLRIAFVSSASCPVSLGLAYRVNNAAVLGGVSGSSATKAVTNITAM